MEPVLVAPGASGARPRLSQLLRRAAMASTDRRRVLRWRDGIVDAGPDSLAIEEPLEIEVDGVSVSTTMRTPGHDIELALGWLVAEGALTSIDEVSEAKECFEHDEDDPEPGTGGSAENRITPEAADLRTQHYCPRRCKRISDVRSP